MEWGLALAFAMCVTPSVVLAPVAIVRSVRSRKRKVRYE
jgi:hypothetical protein